jgi:hypothetical protein
VTEIVKMPGRGHSLTIDAGWREVAQKALEFVKWAPEPRSLTRPSATRRRVSKVISSRFRRIVLLDKQKRRVGRPAQGVAIWAEQEGEMRQSWLQVHRFGAVAVASMFVIPVLESRSLQVGNETASQSSTDATVLKQFDAAVRQYIVLRRRAVAELPPLVVTADPAEISSRSDAIANAILRARGRVSTGDIFSAPVADLLRRRIASIAKDADLADVFTPNPDDEPVTKSVELHSRFPAGSSMATMPPSMLKVLPPLPPELEYRFVGTTLVVRDIHAALVVDVAVDMVSSKP